MSAVLEVFFTDGTSLETDRLVGFRCVRERYTPYSSLTVTAEAECAKSDIVKVDLYVYGRLIHSGTMDNLTVSVSGGRNLLKLTSRGFSAMLSQNEIAPGVLTSVSLNSLMLTHMTVPNITWEDNGDTVRYIYIKEHDSQWAAIVCMGLALKEDYPYVGGTNDVRLSAPSSPMTVSPPELFEEGVTGSYSRVVSDFYMKDVNDSYSYHYTDGFAAARGIRRCKFIPFDRQFIGLDHFGLEYKLRYTERGCTARFAVYPGYNGEELRDRFVFPDGEQREISSVEVCGNSKKGVFTKITCYSDGYCNK